MAKKIFVVAFAILVLCLCCGGCFAADSNTSSINLGNEIMESMDKAGKSIENVISGNMVDGNRDGANNSENDARRNTVEGTVNRMESSAYNTTRTTVEGTDNNGGVSSMTTTTWMWIILVVAAVMIIAAIWYYATRTDD